MWSQDKHRRKGLREVMVQLYIMHASLDNTTPVPSGSRQQNVWITLLMDQNADANRREGVDRLRGSCYGIKKNMRILHGSIFTPAI